MSNVQIIRSARRTLTIQIMPDASVMVKAPLFYPKFKIDGFLREKGEWIRKKQQEIRIRSLNHQPSDGYLYLGKKFPLEFRHNQKNIIELDNKFYIGLKTTNTKTYFTTWYKLQARKIITARVQHYARLAGLEFKSINITSAETRWGSCSSEKTLNFNWKLILAPLEVIDYVVAHELAHLVELNHSRAFWETVRKMYPQYRQYRTWLKRYGENLKV